MFGTLSLINHKELGIAHSWRAGKRFKNVTNQNPVKMRRFRSPSYGKNKSSNRSTSQRGCSSVGSALDSNTADAGSIPRCGKGFSPPESTFSADSLTVSILPRVQSHVLTSVCVLKRSCSPCQSSKDYGKKFKTPSIHGRFGIAMLSLLAFPRGKRPEFPIGEIRMGQRSCKKKKKRKKEKKRIYDDQSIVHLFLVVRSERLRSCQRVCLCM